MFELLDDIKKSWNNSELVLITQTMQSNNSSFFVIPSQAVRYDHLHYIRNNNGENPYISFTDDIARSLGIPFIQTLMESAIVRYPILGRLKNETSFNQSYSISISHRTNNYGFTDRDKAKTIQKFGDFIDNNHLQGKEITELKTLFALEFVIPGNLRVCRSIHGGLKRRNSIVELSLALNELTNHASTSLISPILNEKGEALEGQDAIEFAEEQELPIITDKQIVDLWRSIKKVNKNKILWME